MRPLLLLLVLLPFGAAGPGAAQHVRVVETEPAWVTAGDARVGGVYAGAGGELLMVVDPPGDPPQADHWTYGVRPQPERRYHVTHHQHHHYVTPTNPFGFFTVQNPGPVYAVNLRDGTLWLMRRGTWLRPASRWRLFATVPATETRP